MIPLVKRSTTGMSGNARAETLAPYLAIAREFDAPNLLFTELAETHSRRGLCLLAAYLDDLTLRNAAMEAIELCLKELAPGDMALTPGTVEVVASVEGSLRDKILVLLRDNRQTSDPETLASIGELIESAVPARAARLLRGLAQVGSDNAWRAMTAIFAQRDHPQRETALRALGSWPGDRPRDMLEAILADTEGESTSVRAAALDAVLHLVARWDARRPSRDRVKELEDRLPLARELGIERDWLMAVGSSGTPAAIDTLRRYVEHASLSVPAVEAIDTCTRVARREDMDAVAGKLEALAGKVQPGDLHDALTGIAADLRARIGERQIAPHKALGGPAARETDALSLDDL
jgi:hypothetical protein